LSFAVAMAPDRFYEVSAEAKRASLPLPLVSYLS